MFTFKKPEQEFITSTVTQAVSISAPVTIVSPYFNDETKSFEIKCSDGRTRRCLVTNFPDYQEGKSKKASELFGKLAKAYASQTQVQFIAMGTFGTGNKADVWFFDIKKN